MKRIHYLLIPALFLASCGDGKKQGNKTEDLAKLKKERAALDLKIKELEGNKKDSATVIPVSILQVQPQVFNAYVEVQSEIGGDENVVATSQAPGTVKSLFVVTGQSVSKGQVLALLDASAVDRQIEALAPALTLQKAIVAKQENLWKQNIGAEVQLMTSKANYESAQKQLEALKAQRDMYRIVSPISGKVDVVNLKVGDVAAPGNPTTGIRVVSYDKLKADASLGENYLGKVKVGDPVTLILPDLGDSIHNNLSFVGQVVDPMSRAFTVQVKLANNARLHHNMSAIMRITNYKNDNALVVPVSVIQKTSQGEMLYLADGNKAKSVFVKTGRNSNGQVEVLEGLNPGDQVVVAGYEELDNNQPIKVQ